MRLVTSLTIMASVIVVLIAIGARMNVADIMVAFILALVGMGELVRTGSLWVLQPLRN